MDRFSGFSPAALKFLRDLKKNNERAWFQARKDVYDRELLAPLQALTADLAARVEARLRAFDQAAQSAR